MKHHLQQIYDRAQRLQLDLESVLSSIPAKVSTETVSDLVDSGFLCREVSHIMDTLRKAADKGNSTISKFLAARVAVSAINSATPLALRGELATGTTDVVIKPKIPHQGTPEWIALMKHLGLSDELIESDMFRPSFSSLSAELRRRAMAGEKSPPGIDTTFTEAIVTFRRRKTK